MNEQEAIELKAKLRAHAEKKFPGNTERQRAYIFGTLRKLGWKPKSQE